ncbi:MAG: LysM peptidoglycan-binding domain-containing protein [Anaerolineales bacterium]|nr:LysM peptidoglycan-binding domain-containing protein [Anaerolineales bacterium]
MKRRSIFPILAVLWALLAAVLFPSSSHAEVNDAPQYAGSAFDLINAVNALRSSNGLPAYSISPILMYTAQSQADFMAATGDVTHTGAGGSTVTSRLLAAGYPLAGDLSLGGFRSENIIGGLESMSAQDAVTAWTGDAPHLTTMLSSDLSEIGAGVTVTGGRVYYVIDTALPKSGGEGASAVTPVVVDGTVVPAIGGAVIPVAISTPNADGDVFHEVKAGQSLWQIAIDYKVKIDDIKRLNNLSNNDIYPGEKLLIKDNVLLVTETPTETMTAEVTTSFAPTATLIPVTVPATLTAIAPTHVPQPATSNNRSITGAVLGIIALALVGGWLFIWLGDSKEK